MSDDEENEERSPPPMVRFEDFVSLSLAELINDNSVIDCHDISQQLHQAASAFPEGSAKHALELLSAIAGVADHFDDPAEPFGPILVSKGMRSMIPSDLLGEQTEHLAKFVPNIDNHSLRARAADIAWVNDRKRSEMATIAIDSYLMRVRQYLDGEAHFNFDSDSPLSHQVFDLMRRALQIARATKGKRPYTDVFLLLLGRMNDIAYAQNDLPSITRLTRLSLDFSLEHETDLASRLETALAKSADYDPHWRKHALEQLQRLYRRNGINEKANDCQIQIAECSISLSEKMSASATAASHWLMTAIAELRQATGEVAKQRTREIRKLLRELQEDSIFEMGTHTHSIDIQDLVEATKKRVENLSLGEALGVFASIQSAPNPQELRAQAEKSAIEFPLQSMFSASHMDHEGKTIAKSDSGSFGSSASEDAIRDHILRDMKTLRGIVVASGIEPARQHIQFELPLSQRALGVIAEYSAFVPQYHRSIFTLGFVRFFQGDMLSAGSMLIPQLENSLRYVLKTSGKDPSTIESDFTQVDRSISRLLEYEREPLEAIFGKEIIFELDYLFNLRPGPALRHEFAHGKIPDGHYFSADVIYACWLIFRLTCLPLFRHWDEISSMIDSRGKTSE